MLSSLLYCLFLSQSLFAQQAPEPVQLFLQKAQSHFLAHPTHQNLRNHYYSLDEGQSKAIVFLPGMGESGLKYYDLFSQLNLKGFTFYSWDYIGQGFSSHLLPQETHKVHIDSFETHVVALQKFLQSLRPKYREIVVIGHSMGGHVALLLAQETPGLIDRLVLSAPLIDINQRWIPIAVVSWILSAFPDTSYPPFYFLLTKKSADGHFVTNSRERFQEYQKTMEQYPSIRRLGSTLGWIRAAQRSIQKMSSLDFTQMKTPVYILQAESDFLVDNEKQNQICKKIPHCQIEMIIKSKHEILFEVDDVRTQAFQKIRKFILRPH